MSRNWKNELYSLSLWDLQYEIPSQSSCKQKNKKTEVIYLVPKKSDSFFLYKPLNLIFLSFFSKPARTYIQSYLD